MIVQYLTAGPRLAEVFEEMRKNNPDALSEYARIGGMAIEGPTGYYNGLTETNGQAYVRATLR